MFWVLQENVFNEEGMRSLVETLKRFGIGFSEHKVVPFIGELHPDPVIPEGSDVIVMGSYSMSRYAAKMGWTPGSFANENHDFRAQLPHWGDHMLNASADIVKLRDVPEQLRPFFIRPVDDTKSFSGTVMDWGEYCEWRDRILAVPVDEFATVTGDTLVMVSPTVKIYCEYRLWVVDGKIVTASLYKAGTRVHYDGAVESTILEFASQFVGGDRWEPARAYCLDVFDTEIGIKIGEVNNINSAGFYAADMQRLVAAIEDMEF